MCVICLCFLEVKPVSGNRLSHIPCQQAVVNAAVSVECSRVEMSGTNSSYSVTSAENIGQQSSLDAAGGWSRAGPGSSVALTGLPQTEFSSSLQSAGVSSQSSGFHCSQTIPLSGLSHTSNVQVPSQPFTGYPDGSTQLQSSVHNHANPSTTSLVCCDDRVFYMPPPRAMWLEA